MIQLSQLKWHPINGSWSYKRLWFAEVEIENHALVEGLLSGSFFDVIESGYAPHPINGFSLYKWLCIQ